MAVLLCRRTETNGVGELLGLLKILWLEANDLEPGFITQLDVYDLNRADAAWAEIDKEGARDFSCIYLIKICVSGAQLQQLVGNLGLALPAKDAPGWEAFGIAKEGPAMMPFTDIATQRWIGLSVLITGDHLEQIRQDLAKNNNDEALSYESF